MATASEVAKILNALADFYPDFKLSTETIAAYARLLHDIPADQLEAATLEHARTSRWFPKVSELMDKVVIHRKETAHIPTAYEAWNELLHAPADGIGSRAVEEDGRWIIEHWQWEFSHPIVDKVARQLGWPGLFPGREETEMGDRAHFLRAYESEMGQLITKETRLPEVQKYIDEHTSPEIKRLAERLDHHE